MCWLLSRPLAVTYYCRFKNKIGNTLVLEGNAEGRYGQCFEKNCVCVCMLHIADQMSVKDECTGLLGKAL